MQVGLAILVPACRATFSDLFDRGSDQYVQTMNNIENVSSVLRLVSLYIVGTICQRARLYRSGIVSILSSLAFYFFVEETWKNKSKSDRMEEIAQPLSSPTFFTQSRDLKSIAYLFVLAGDTRV